MSAPLADEEIVEDALLGGQVRLRQPRTGHRAGTDAVMLAASIAGADGRAIVDLGAGAGTIGLILAARFPSARVTLVERDPAMVRLACENIVLNGWLDRVSAIEADLFAPAAERQAKGLKPDSFDLIVTNPPWFGARHVRRSPNVRRRSAHVLEKGTLDDWLRAAAGLLAPRGEIALVHRADAMAEVLAALSGRFGAVHVRPVQPYAGKPATRLLVRAVKGSRAPLTIEPPLILHRSGGSFTDEAEAMHRPGGNEG